MKKVDFMPTVAIKAMVGDHQAAGKRFDLMATFEAKADGKWCLVAIEESAMPGYGKDEEQPEQKDSKFMETYEKARAGEMEGGTKEGSGY